MPARWDFDWVFFDCFNTLVDDFDDSGDESGLCTLPGRAVAEGYFGTEADFIACYRGHRDDLHLPHQEVPFDESLRRTIAGKGPSPSAERDVQTISAWLRQWEGDYLRLLRPTPGASAALTHWAKQKPCGVISNFFLPHYPAGYLRHFGLDRQLRFVLDSAAFGTKKPHAAIFHEAMKRAGLKPHQAKRVLFIGDRLDLDILPARELGMQVLHFNRTKSRQNVAPTPARIPVIYDWSEFV